MTVFRWTPVVYIDSNGSLLNTVKAVLKCLFDDQFKFASGNIADLVATDTLLKHDYCY